jgi:hypothetical protein
MKTTELAIALDITPAQAEELSRLRSPDSVDKIPGIGDDAVTLVRTTPVDVLTEIQKFDAATLAIAKAPNTLSSIDIEQLKYSFSQDKAMSMGETLKSSFGAITDNEINAIDNAIRREANAIFEKSFTEPLTFDDIGTLASNISSQITLSATSVITGTVSSLDQIISGAIGDVINSANFLFSTIVGAIYGAIFGPLNILAHLMFEYWEPLIQLISDTFLAGKFFFFELLEIPKELGKGFADIRVGVLPGSIIQRPLTKQPLLPSESDVHRVSRGDDTVKQPGGMKYSYDQERDPLLKDPPMEYDATYPYNHYFESESGHVFEYDDTPSFERIQWKHRTGSGMHINPDGTTKFTVVGDSYKVVFNDNKVHILGDAETYIDGTSTISVNGDAKISIGLNADISVGKNMTFDVGENLTFNVGETIKMSCKKSELKTQRLDVQAWYLSYTKLVKLDLPKVKPLHPMGTAKYLKFDEKHEGWLVEGRGSSRITTTDVKIGLEDGELSRAEKAERQPDIVMATEESPIESRQTSPPSDSCNVQAPKNPGNPRDPAYDQKISKYFYLRDMCWAIVSKNALQAQNGLTVQQIVNNLCLLARTALDPIVDLYGKPSFTTYGRSGGPIHFTSNFRRGSGKSWHLRGCAADMQFVGIPTSAYYNRACEIRDKVSGWDHILLEYKTTGTKMPWIHIGVISGRATGKCQTYMNHALYKNGFHNLASRAKK